MTILMIDGQSGRLGAQIIEGLKKTGLPEQHKIIAVGTNSLATSGMISAGAHQGATGENAVLVQCRYADIIVGPIGILVADAMLGEITETMSLAIGRSSAKKLLLPVNQCGNLVAGTQNMSLSRVMEEAVSALKDLLV